jgi:hypothetical protein
MQRRTNHFAGVIKNGTAAEKVALCDQQLYALKMGLAL